MDRYLTSTFTHLNNPTGAASRSSVATNQTCTPLDPLTKQAAQAYPIEKLHLLRVFYTKYAALATGDAVTVSGETFTVKAVCPWAALGSLDTFYEVVAEKTLGS